MKLKRLTAEAAYSPGVPDRIIEEREALAVETWWQGALLAMAKPIWPSVVMRRRRHGCGQTVFAISGMAYRPAAP
jgi:hypothetical protein